MKLTQHNKKYDHGAYNTYLHSICYILGSPHQSSTHPHPTDVRDAGPLEDPVVHSVEPLDLLTLVAHHLFPVMAG